MDFIESIPTQGSVFYKFIDIKGNFSDELFCLESIKNFLGDICVFLEKKIKGKWMFVGMAFGNYKRDITYYSKQYYSSLLFLEHFRGYGLAKILTLLAIFYNIDQYDAIIEQSTAFNNVVKNLVQRAGFKDYGLIKNSVYSINPNLNHKNYQKTSECPLVCTGFFRRFIFVENYADIVKQALSKVENDSEVIQRLY